MVHGRYPNGDPSSSSSFTYRASDCTSSAPPFGADNSTSEYFVKELYDKGYINDPWWNDPLNPSFFSRYNCRYIVPKSEQDASDVQRYLLHCAVEANFGAAQQDGGNHPELLEIFSGDTPWLCVTDIPLIEFPKGLACHGFLQRHALSYGPGLRRVARHELPEALSHQIQILRLKVIEPSQQLIELLEKQVRAYSSGSANYLLLWPREIIMTCIWNPPGG